MQPEPVRLELLDARGRAVAQDVVTRRHYLRRPVDVRSMPEAYTVRLPRFGAASFGCLIVGRPEATRCYPWYGSLDDVASGRAEHSRWEVLCLSRVWVDPVLQTGGALCRPGVLPGYRDRRGTWRSTLASTLLRQLADRVVVEYLVRRPPCFLDEPYQLRWLLSYCDTRIHRGTIYRAAGWELYRTNSQGIQTWRTPLRPLTIQEHAAVREASRRHPRSIAHRARRAAAGQQLVMERL